MKLRIDFLEVVMFRYHMEDILRCERSLHGDENAETRIQLVQLFHEVARYVYGSVKGQVAERWMRSR